MAWRDFRDCSRTYPRLKHVQLLLQSSEPGKSLFRCKNGKPFDVLRLTQLAPGLIRLETSEIYLFLDEGLVAFVWDIIHGCGGLLNLTLNKDFPRTSKPKKRNEFKRALIAAGNARLYDCSTFHMRYSTRDEILIWL